MKIIELKKNRPTLTELIGQAKKEIVVLRQSDGSMFALSPLDEFDVEAEILKNNPEFMAFLQELSQDNDYVSLHDLRMELGLPNGKPTRDPARSKLSAKPTKRRPGKNRNTK